MPYAVNPIDGVRTYFEDDGGPGPPIVFLPGFMEPLEVARASGLAEALSPAYRLLYVDHRGHGRSDKPHEAGAYALTTRCADVVSVLDACGLDGIGTLLDAGTDLVLGLVPSVAPTTRPQWRELAGPAVTLIDRLGFPRTTLRSRVAVTPRCGLAGASLEWARRALRLCAEVSRAFT